MPTLTPDERKALREGWRAYVDTNVRYLMYEELGRPPLTRWQRVRRWIGNLVRWR